MNNSGVKTGVYGGAGGMMTGREQQRKPWLSSNLSTTNPTYSVPDLNPELRTKKKMFNSLSYATSHKTN
jgi:tRNA-dihydrouridine synthase